MTSTATPRPPQDWLPRLEALPLVLSDGRGLQDFLARDTTRGRDGAEAALREYRRFLALALAAPGELRMPGPMIAQLWQLHREDSASYAAFLGDLGQGAALATRRARWDSARQGITASEAYVETRAAYEASFGPAPRRWWPRRAKPQGRARYYHLIALHVAAILLIVWDWSAGSATLGHGLLLLAFAPRIVQNFWREAREPSAFRLYGPATALMAA